MKNYIYIPLVCSQVIVVTFCVSAHIFNTAMNQRNLHIKEKKVWISQSHLRSSDFHVSHSDSSKVRQLKGNLQQTRTVALAKYTSRFKTTKM